MNKQEWQRLTRITKNNNTYNQLISAIKSYQSRMNESMYISKAEFWQKMIFNNDYYTLKRWYQGEYDYFCKNK